MSRPALYLAVLLSVAYLSSTVAVPTIGRSALRRSFDVDAQPLSSTPFDPILSLADSLNAARDPSVNPCDDFYHYACGGWLNTTVMPDEELKYTRSFSTILLANQRTLQAIFESNESVLTPFYVSCLDEDRIDAEGISALAALLDLFNEQRNANLSSQFHSLGVLSRLQLIHPLVSLEVEVDPSSPSRQWLSLSQPSLSLPSSSLYSSPSHLDSLRRHISAMWRLVGLSPERAAVDAERAVALERLLANLTVAPTHLRDPHAAFNPTNFSSLQALAPHIPWPALFDGLQLSTPSPPLNVAVPSYLVGLSTLLGSRTDAVLLLSSYARWRLLHFFAQDLPRPLAAEHFRAFNAALHGQRSPTPRWRFCVDRTVQSLSELSGLYFMHHRFPPSHHLAASTMVAAIRSALHSQLAAAPWLDEGTRVRALEKLEAVVSNIGGAPASAVPPYPYPPTPRTYLANLLRLRGDDAGRVWRRLAAPTDRRRWQMAASESNAYYEPTTNSISFPAGIVQPPFFDAVAPSVLQYAGLGMIVGHELSHGFDDQGRLYDGEGALRGWWGEGAAEGFGNRSRCFEHQYGGLEVETSHGREAINGRLTLGENIADNAGMQLAYAAWRERSGGREVERLQEALRPRVGDEAALFYLAFATDWCQKVRPEFAHLALLTDVHSPAVARVNGVVMNSPQFAEAFQCPLGSPMNPQLRCSLYL